MAKLMTMKSDDKTYVYFRQQIKKEHQEKLKLKEVKVSLAGLNKEQREILRMFLEVLVYEINLTPDKFIGINIKEYVEIEKNKKILTVLGFELPNISDYDLKKCELKEVFALKDGFQLYKTYKRDKKKVSDKTIINYGHYFKKISSILTEDYNLNLVNRKVLISVQNELMKNLGSGAVNNYIAFFYGLITHLRQEDYINIETFSNVDKIEEDFNHKKKESLSDDEIKCILDFVNNDANINKKSDRDVFMAHKIMVYTGLRVGELLNVKVGDVVNNEAINITLDDTKTKRHKRYIPVHSDLKLDLLEFIANREPKEPLLFSSFSYTEKTKQKLLNLFLKPFVNGYKTIHSYKHTVQQKLQIANPQYLVYVDILMAHKITGVSEIGFIEYGKNKTNFKVMQDIINSIEY